MPSMNPPLFKTMLALTSLYTDANEMNDCVLLVVLPDLADAVDSLLRVLYHKS